MAMHAPRRRVTHCHLDVSDGARLIDRPPTFDKAECDRQPLGHRADIVVHEMQRETAATTVSYEHSLPGPA